MKRRTKFVLAAVAALLALGFAFYQLYVPRTTTSAVSKFGFGGASALRSGGKIACRRVFEPQGNVVAELEETGLPVPPTTYSSWVELSGWEADAVRAELADKAERFINLATACRFHPDVEIVVHDGSGVPAITVVLCYSCSKWIDAGGTHGRFDEDGALGKIISRHLLDPGWLSEGDEPPASAVTSFGTEAARSLLVSLNEVRMRRVFPPSMDEREAARTLGVEARPTMYSEWSQLNPDQAKIIRSQLLNGFHVWGEYRLACLPRWDTEIEWLDESCRPVGRVTLCHSCGMWYSENSGGLFWESAIKPVMLEVFPEAKALFEH